MSFSKVSSNCDDFQFMKCEEYMNVIKSFHMGYVIYRCFVTYKSDFYNISQLIYTIKYNRLHKASIYDANNNCLGYIEGRDREWNYKHINIALYDFPTIDAPYMNMHTTVHNEKYHCLKPKPKGWFDLSLHMNYLAIHAKRSHCNLKLINSDNATVLVCCALAKKNYFHCITNLNILDAFIIFCVRNWCY